MCTICALCWSCYCHSLCLRVLNSEVCGMLQPLPFAEGLYQSLLLITVLGCPMFTNFNITPGISSPNRAQPNSAACAVCMSKPGQGHHRSTCQVTSDAACKTTECSTLWHSRTVACIFLTSTRRDAGQQAQALMKP